jgi:hypothetical protein
MLTHGITVLPTIPSVGDDAWNARNHARPAVGFLESGAAGYKHRGGSRDGTGPVGTIGSPHSREP